MNWPQRSIAAAWSSRGSRPPVLKVEHGEHDADAVLNLLFEEREIRGPLRHDFSIDLAILEPKRCVVFARNRLHLSILCEAAHVEPLQPAIARSTNYAPHQARSNTFILPGTLDRERGFGLL